MQYRQGVKGEGPRHPCALCARPGCRAWVLVMPPPPPPNPPAATAAPHVARRHHRRPRARLGPPPPPAPPRPTWPAAATGAPLKSCPVTGAPFAAAPRPTLLAATAATSATAARSCRRSRDARSGPHGPTIKSAPSSRPPISLPSRRVKSVSPQVSLPSSQPTGKRGAVRGWGAGGEGARGMRRSGKWRAEAEQHSRSRSRNRNRSRKRTVEVGARQPRHQGESRPLCRFRLLSQAEQPVARYVV